jgi:hypothetical protein
MRTTKKQSTNQSPSDGFASWKPTLTLAEVTATFVAKHKKASDGDNDHLRDFLQVAQFICENQKTFSFNDFLALTRHLDTPADKLAGLFHQWIAELQASDRLKFISGCYDFPQFIFK